MTAQRHDGPETPEGTLSPVLPFHFIDSARMVEESHDHRGAVMTVDSVGGTALGLLRQRAILRVLLAVVMTIATGVALLLPTPAANARVIEGTARDDRIVGTAEFDRIRALDGDDVVAARDGSDEVYGGPGDDTIRGGPGRDQWLEEKSGNDTIFRGTNADWHLSDGWGDDEIRGRGQHDQISLGPGADSAYGGRGRDHIALNLTRRNGSDSVHGGHGNDYFEVESDGGYDLIACGPGSRDIVSYNALYGRDELDQLTNCEIVRID